MCCGKGDGSSPAKGAECGKEKLGTCDSGMTADRFLNDLRTIYEEKSPKRRTDTPYLANLGRDLSWHLSFFAIFAGAFCRRLPKIGFGKCRLYEKSVYLTLVFGCS